MKLNAICMVKNEADVIEETLLNAAAFCHKIYVFDNGSDDGTWEIVQRLADSYENIEVAFHSFEVFKNQLRNRVYNKYHQLYSRDDWWYILDADEMLVEDPKPRLEKAMAKGKDCMHVWQAQFYFTDKDQENYHLEDMSQPTSMRRNYYRINWREVRFFQNDPNQDWPETVTGRIPPFRGKFYQDSPICRHYAQRTPEQIKMRNQLRINNPYSFFHIKNKSKSSWIMPASNLFTYNNDGKFTFPLRDKTKYFANEFRYWLQWRMKNLHKLPARLQKAL